jgi:hypothetical protein
MKIKTLFLATTFILFALASVGQTKATLYKANQWLDIKSKGGWAKAYKDPTKEKAEVLLTIKSIKVTLGAKTYDYKLISFYRFSPVQWRYVVTLNGKTYEIVISQHSLEIDNETYSIGIEGEWMLASITDVSVVDIK